MAPQLHLVAGCGGAFMHGTHDYVNAEHDSRLRNSPKHEFYKLPDWSFPTPADSFAYFAGQLVPSVIRTMRYLALFLLGVLGTAAIGWLAGGAACRSRRGPMDGPNRTARPDRPGGLPQYPARRTAGIAARARSRGDRLPSGRRTRHERRRSSSTPAPFTTYLAVLARAHGLPLPDRRVRTPFRLVAPRRRIRPQPVHRRVRYRPAAALRGRLRCAVDPRPCGRSRLSHWLVRGCSSLSDGSAGCCVAHDSALRRRRTGPGRRSSGWAGKTGDGISSERCWCLSRKWSISRWHCTKSSCSSTAAGCSRPPSAASASCW